MKVELHWFAGCPNHERALEMLRAAMTERGLRDEIALIDIGDPGVAARHRSAGSPTIRIDGRDIEPGYEDTGDYTPRCRLYATGSGLGGVPERAWIEQALDAGSR